jgi:hypothetical protein
MAGRLVSTLGAIFEFVIDHQALIFWGGLALLLAVLVPAALIQDRNMEAVKSLFKNHLEEYLTCATDAQARRSATPYLKGKLITLERQADWPEPHSEVPEASVSARTVSDYTLCGKLYWELPDELRAESPDEVETIVQSDWDYTVLAWYSDGRQKHAAVRIRCTVTVINRASATVTDSRVFLGSAPPLPDAKYLGRDWERDKLVGSDPIEEVVAYLMALPRG